MAFTVWRSRWFGGEGDGMRVAQVTATFPPYLAGTGNVCFHNARELARQGHEVTVLTAEQPRRGYRYPSSCDRWPATVRTSLPITTTSSFRARSG